uniref:ShKT domain-containing protein n=2 Tax=Clytia hemisphaerica TaxID=252671 RepID=A0A7M5WZP5_9CNID
MGDDCYDLSDKCPDYADHFDDDYCNHPKYAKWMSQACKESCLYCKDCTDKSPYCETLKKNGLCVAKNRQVYSWMVMECSKSCGYCFEKSVFQKDITKVTGQRP